MNSYSDDDDGSMLMDRLLNLNQVTNMLIAHTTLSPDLSRPLRLLLIWLAFLSLYSGSSRSSTTLVASMVSPTSASPSLSPPPGSVSLIVATRLHLGQSTSPPADLDEKVAGFYRFCAESCPVNANANTSSMGVLAVDATPKIPGYDLVEAVQAACDKAVAAAAAAAAASSSTTSTTAASTTRLHVLPVTPWGKFVPALNALVQFAATTISPPLYEKDSPHSDSSRDRDRCRHQILFCSAETSCSAQAVRTLQWHLQADTAVVGACLPGHEYHNQGTTTTTKTGTGTDVVPGGCVELNGRTSPWNTLALWDLRKLALTGFLLVSDGLLSDDETDPSFGIEEVVATCLLQKLLGADQAKSKLVQLTASEDVVDWNQAFDDPARQKWHEEKMASKLSRANKQLELTGLSGVVHHC
jgi:hypothetical protein